MHSRSQSVHLRSAEHARHSAPRTTTATLVYSHHFPTKRRCGEEYSTWSTWTNTFYWQRYGVNLWIITVHSNIICHSYNCFPEHMMKSHNTDLVQSASHGSQVSLILTWTLILTGLSMAHTSRLQRHNRGYSLAIDHRGCDFNLLLVFSVLSMSST